MIFGVVLLAICEVGAPTAMAVGDIDTGAVIAGVTIVIAAAKSIVGIDTVLIVRLIHENARRHQIAGFGVEIVVFAAIEPPGAPASPVNIVLDRRPLPERSEQQRFVFGGQPPRKFTVATGEHVVETAVERRVQQAPCIAIRTLRQFLRQQLVGGVEIFAKEHFGEGADDGGGVLLCGSFKGVGQTGDTAGLCLGHALSERFVGYADQLIGLCEADAIEMNARFLTEVDIEFAQGNLFPVKFGGSLQPVEWKR